MAVEDLGLSRRQAAAHFGVSYSSDSVGEALPRDRQPEAAADRGATGRRRLWARIATGRGAWRRTSRTAWLASWRSEVLRLTIGRCGTSCTPRIWCARRTGRRLGVQVPRNEGVTKPRFSASRALAPARGQAKRRQRHGWAGLLSTVKAMVRGAEAFRSVEGNIAGVVLVRCRRAPRCQRTHARSHAFCWDPGRSSNCPGCRRGAA